MNIVSPKGSEYGVGELLGETEEFRLYECVLPDGSPGILKIATTPGHNGVLDREAFILDILRKEAVAVEAEYARVKPDSKKKLNYAFNFPSLVESFISPEQEGRRVLIVHFHEISKELADLAPLGHLASREHVRVDARTSAWILGKLLKILVFAHSLGITFVTIDGDNILINREEHYVALFDWSKAIRTSRGQRPPSAATRGDIESVAREVVLALGGNPATATIPDDPDLPDEYRDIVLSIANGGFED
ncbi:MAG TPA: hypothetical protein VFT82_02035, partial [Candidatus Paceibacterota bacterium]|nr:hypothetical protein [Candidatus Paceibacterota bacterium]